MTPSRFRTAAAVVGYALLLEYVARCLTYAGTIVYALRLDHPFYSAGDLLFVPLSPITYDGTVLAVDSVQTTLEHGKMAFGLTTPRGLSLVLPVASYLVGLAVVYAVHRRFGG